MGPITWACLLLAVHQGPSDDNYLNGPFQIPIRLNSQRHSEIRRLFLYVSEDEGKVWQVTQYAQPGEQNFVFRPKHDGKYWFIVGTEDQRGAPSPANPMRVKPNQCVVVDTLKPQVKVTAERLPSGEVLAHWTITEENPDPASLRLDYHTDAMRPDQWTPLPADGQSGQGQKQFSPGSAGEVRVRVQIKDRAQNLGQGEAVVSPSSSAAASTVGDTPKFGPIPVIPADQCGQLVSRQTPHSPGESPRPGTLTPNGAPMQLMPPDEANPANRSALVASASDRSSTAAGFTPETPRGALPPLKIVKTKEVKLDFEVAKFGPSGLGGTAEVYVTINEGASWSRLPNDLPVTLPPLTDGHGTTPVRGSVSVQLPAESTIYGFIVAVKSKAGLARQAPKPGEPPQVRIELDATPPRAELIRPVPDQNQRDTLILAWTAVDRNLPANPITLEWAERKEGPWRIIGEGPLPNTGQYPWHLPEGIPSRVFLKLTVRDSAGNAAEAKTEKPELIDLSVPETSIIGVGPSAR